MVLYLIDLSMRRTLIAERSQKVHVMQYRRGTYILNSLRAQIEVNKTVSLTYRGVSYEKQL